MFVGLSATLAASASALMFVWRKFIPLPLASAWESRLAALGLQPVATVWPGRKSALIEVHRGRRSELALLPEALGGRIRQVHDRDWAAISAGPLPPVRIRDRLVVVSARSRKEITAARRRHPGREVIAIPPELGFGTGHHATTATVLRLLADQAAQWNRQGRQWSMADIGTGSGVLAIAARKLGAAGAWGCDHDPLAVKAARGNLARNDASQVVIVRKDVLRWRPRHRFDCLAANIFHDVLVASFPRLVAALKPGGIILVSGILASQAEECLAAGRRAGLVFTRIVRGGKWVTAQGRARRVREDYLAAPEAGTNCGWPIGVSLFFGT